MKACAVLLLAALTVPTALTAQSRATAITNATIIPVVGQRIDRGTVVIQDGKISAVGANVPVPAGAEVIDASGMFVYPGLVDGGTQLGLTEITEQGGPGPTDLRELGDFNPADRALTAVNPFSEIIPTVRVNGITTVITAPNGNQVSGQAALIDLNGWTPREMAEIPSAGMIMTYPRSGPAGRGGGFGPPQTADQQRERVAREAHALHDYLANARAYADVARRTADSSTHPAINLELEAMVPVMRGEMPAIFDVETAAQIRGVLVMADSFGLKVILRGASYAWEMADTLAARHIPVIVGPTTELPGPTDPYDMIYANPGVLARAGVQIAFQTNSAPDSRNLAYNAALATAYGLDPDEALRALTINPARIFGVQDRLGSIEAGKVANIIVATGDPLDVRTTMRYVFIRGVNMPFNDVHSQEYERWRNRPRPAAAGKP
ncbi:MAG TPA: amidohydrolase family protein [Gemmatimonadales bacterium]|jgi:imidazolonepropionase-like amidohydrolase